MLHVGDVVRVADEDMEGVVYAVNLTDGEVSVVAGSGRHGKFKEEDLILLAGVEYEIPITVGDRVEVTDIGFGEGTVYHITPEAALPYAVGFLRGGHTGYFSSKELKLIGKASYRRV